MVLKPLTRRITPLRYYGEETTDIENFMIRKRVMDIVEHYGVNRSFIAKSVGLSTTGLYKWIAGKYNLSRTNLEKIEEFASKYPQTS